MNKWIEAAKLDLLGREGEQQLTQEERTTYSLALGSASATGAVAALAAGWWPASVVLGLVAARKVQIYIKRRRRT